MSDTDPSPHNVPSTTPWPPRRALAQKVPGRTRLFDVASFSRYRRRKLIRAIENATERKLLCYVSGGREIDQVDAFDLVRLLEAIAPGARITLLLDSPGGDVDAAEKMVHLLHEACAQPSCTTDDLQIVVPNTAKSAATLIAIGADRILMSDSSELGPIDPQLLLSDDYSVPVFALLRAYEEAEQRCIRHPDNGAFAAELGKFNATLVAEMRQVVSRARICAEKLLQRQGANSTEVAATLMDIDRFPSHGQMIDWRTAKAIGIPQVHPLPRNNPLWQLYWRLYCRLLRICGTGRVFESVDQTITVNDSRG